VLTVGQRVVMITGASSGVGRDTARLFAGAWPWCWPPAASRRCPPPPNRSHRGRSYPPTSRCGRRCSTRRSWPSTASAGSMSWINNAAVSGYGELKTLPVAAIDPILDVDLRGQLYGVKAVPPILRPKARHDHRRQLRAS